MNNILAALTFFTRLPFWKIKQVPQESFKHLVSYWSISGWLTGGIMGLVFWLSVHALPVGAAIMLAFISRLLVTGALHEDGLADFFDGFGGGRDRESILRIMKDSHTGSYGVLGLIVYFLLACNLLTTLPASMTPWILLGGDAWSKFTASQLINFLPYARKEEESKNKTVYTRMSVREIALSAAGGVLPLLLLPPLYWVACLLPVLTFSFLVTLFRKKLQGYTGDCCGATFLLCELSFWLGIVFIYYSQI
ncbi:cobalamin-5-phosphate synthase [Bacteroides pyogenes F0041]|uniref:Adenosylcobinamide-GDP ribazoletransferase n=1 Tax=Bacteroides pyogenes F0041 TaxID=1321819 RepID=U2CXL6_9BACE|nr:adenosylcobinamide-GDP ribazoletransferase [Bacteroides pyogenes]ERI88813.1 cobalamin-5-phosphate synthase [Bacteroides pyogenes F0041]MBB3896282.1 adenosylcobinamide-GDP ribazoletransferase [Bacteroides pyogenes]GAE23128.1 cobalamin synthase [Bacteroides pyogenes JCM 10003]SUV31336.1 cobalamin-5'-phosphate synthase [Bacteroides pyogenes]